MGAETDYRVLDGSLEGAALRQAWAAEVEQALYDNGHGGYTGSIAEDSGDPIKIKDLSFETIDAAGQWLDENAEKWGPSIAVKAVDHAFEPVWVVGGVYSC